MPAPGDSQATAPSPEAIQAFTERYGLLGLNFRTAPGLTGDQPPRQAPNLPVGEPLGAWQRQICEMRRLVVLWLLCRDGDQAGLAGHIVWRPSKKGRPQVCYTSEPVDKAVRQSPPESDPPGGCPPVRETIASWEADPQVLKRYGKGDELHLADLYLSRKINEHLAGLVTPALRYDGKRSRVHWDYLPVTLLGGLWLQFALAVQGRKHYRRCDTCQAWFEASPDPTRTNQRFCSTLCRVKDHRRKQERARQLFNDGRTVEAIARELESDPATVEKCIGIGKE